jgi:mono/diheme cytochrome c family protein
MACSKTFPGIFSLLLAIIFVSCVQGHRQDESSVTDKNKFRQYMVQGKKLFEEHCGNCHQDDGSGLARLYPPLRSSDYLAEDKNRTLCIIRFGQKGEIFVNNVSFNMEMPVNPQLTNLDYAEISTYVISVFTKKSVLIQPEEIERLSVTCGYNNQDIKKRNP